MPRANRYIVSGPAYHVTHRCHDRTFLLRFAKDRDAYREMLRRQLAARPEVRLLTYCITCNHVHLLLASHATDEAVSGLMQALEGEFAGYYNRRKGRSGAFWGGRSGSPRCALDRMHRRGRPDFWPGSGPALKSKK